MNAPRQKISRWGWLALGFWLLVFAVIFSDVLRRPLVHTTMPTYRLAATQWWQGQDVYSYNAHAGFLYFPQAAFLFTPFNVVPFYAGELLWRAATFGLLAYALVRLNNFFLPRDGRAPGKTFLLLSLLVVPSSLASLRNAQFDLPLAALTVLATAEIARARWTPASAWLGLGLALKPLMAVPLLLFGALYRKLIPCVAVALAVVLALPFLHWSPAFVAHEYVRCWQTLVWATDANEPRYSELGALLAHLGLYPPNGMKTIARVIFALVYLGLGFAAVRRLNVEQAAWTVGALSADYLMLFNPRTETCSYVFLGPFVASLALLYLSGTGRKALGWFLVFASLGLACDAIPVVHYLTDRWLKPLIALLFLPLLIEFVFGKRADREPPRFTSSN